MEKKGKINYTILNNWLNIQGTKILIRLLKILQKIISYFLNFHNIKGIWIIPIKIFFVTNKAIFSIMKKL